MDSDRPIVSGHLSSRSTQHSANGGGEGDEMKARNTLGVARWETPIGAPLPRKRPKAFQLALVPLVIVVLMLLSPDASIGEYTVLATAPAIDSAIPSVALGGHSSLSLPGSLAGAVSPTPRESYAATWDPLTDAEVLFGGYSGVAQYGGQFGVLNDT